VLVQKNTEAFNRLSTAEIKEKIIKKLVARIEIDTNSFEVQFLQVNLISEENQKELILVLLLKLLYLGKTKKIMVRGLVKMVPLSVSV
jgi:hypothetical protein